MNRICDLVEDVKKEPQSAALGVARFAVGRPLSTVKHGYNHACCRRPRLGTECDGGRRSEQWMASTSVSMVCVVTNEEKQVARDQLNDFDHSYLHKFQHHPSNPHDIM